ncbi:3-deoxy-manno-octulosonate cytidylyltransferase [bacterium]|nr:3-deoxy-manno-octulosonate cytidylyltransferase [bacterium]
MGAESVNYNVLAVIPARLGSTRLGRKPLQEIDGKSLIQHVWQQAAQVSSLQRVVLATDSAEISQVATSFGAEVIMTSADAPSGTDRVYQAWQRIDPTGKDFQIILNIQGDMPFISVAAINGVIQVLKENYDQFSMTTIAVPIMDQDQFAASTVVKVALSPAGQALYFSRAPIPHSRDGVIYPNGVLGYRHIGLYAYTPESLTTFATSKQALLERIEMLEQLRVLENGHSIGVYILSHDEARNFVEVDTPQDLQRAREVALGLK